MCTAPQKSNLFKGVLLEDPKLMFGKRVPVNNPCVQLLRE